VPSFFPAWTICQPVSILVSRSRFILPAGDGDDHPLDIHLRDQTHLLFRVTQDFMATGSLKHETTLDGSSLIGTSFATKASAISGIAKAQLHNPATLR
jgi:hypothetical protein